MKSKEIQISTLVGAGAELDGDFKATGSARIDGSVKGNVTVENALVIGATGIINGKVIAKSVVIGGEVNGNVEAPEKAELTATAKVIGDISTNLIVIDEHAVFHGRCDMNQTPPDKKTRARAVGAGRKSAKAAIVQALKEVKEAEDAIDEVAEEA